jgi:hypothetical protein
MDEFKIIFLILFFKMEFENFKFKQQISKYENNQKVPLIIQEYEKRFEYVNSLSRKLKQNAQTDLRNRIGTLASFCSFLRNKQEFDQITPCGGYFKWHILNKIVIDFTKEEKGLLNLNKMSSSFLDKLNFGLENLSDYKKISLVIPSSYRQEHQKLLDEYKTKVNSAIVLNIILEYAIKKDYFKALGANLYLNEIVKYYKNHSFK